MIWGDLYKKNIAKMMLIIVNLLPSQSNTNFSKYQHKPNKIKNSPCYSSNRMFLMRGPTSIWENYREVSWIVKLFKFFNMVVIFHKMSASAKIKTSPATPAYYSYEHAHSKHISSTSHFWHLPEARADKKNDPWCLPVILVCSNLIFMKIHILMKFWPSYVTQCLLLFRFK